MIKYALLLFMVLIVGCQGEVAEQEEVTATLENDTVTQDSTGEVKEFLLDGENYRFLLNGQEAPELRVAQGDTVRIVLGVNQGIHDWVIDEFNAQTDRISVGETTSVEFVADRTGTFEYYCSVGIHRSLGMVGNLIVE